MFLQTLITRTKNSTRIFFVVITFSLYVGVFTYLHYSLGMEITAVAIVPIVLGSWFFGITGGVLTTVISAVATIGSLLIFGHNPEELLSGTGYFIGNLIFLFVAVIVGYMSTIMRERSEAFQKLEELEQERRNYTELLESLTEITKIVLEAQDLRSALSVLVESIGKLFHADDCFFAFWDEENKVTLPMTAYGPMRETYSSASFAPGERTLSAIVMEMGYPLIIEDLKSYPPFDPSLSSIYPIHTVMSIPLTVQGKKIAVLHLGYMEKHQFGSQDLVRAEMAAQQISLVITKLRLLESMQLQVRQLTVLHQVAIIATEAVNFDQLIERTTEIIGENLFPDNFGIFLVDEKRNILHPHSSYRFTIGGQIIVPNEVPFGSGISGKVAQTGLSLRTGNISEIENYLNIDKRTVSELCVPIKIKNRILGVINTESSKLNAFTQDDENLLETLASQLANAIEKLRTEEAERKWLKQLSRSNELTYSLARITTYIEKKHHTDEIVQTIGDELNKIHITSMISIFDQEKQIFKINYSSLSKHDMEIIEDAIAFPLMDYTFSMQDLHYRIAPENLAQPVVVPDLEDEFQLLVPSRYGNQIRAIIHGTGIDLPKEIFRLPLLFEEKLLGILWLWGENVTQSDLPTMATFANQIGTNIQNTYLFEEIQSLALTDPLTQLHNRRSLFELGHIEFSRAVRMDRPFCCMMLDLDHFKKINDTYGHATGDFVLQQFATHCKESVREVDLVGRYGGEELVILMPETDLYTARAVAERLRSSLSQKIITIPDHELKITTSIGVAGRDKNTKDLEILIARSDQAMYIAKHKGRNLVAVSV